MSGSLGDFLLLPTAKKWRLFVKFTENTASGVTILETWVQL